jgi:hypothetical protein
VDGGPIDPTARAASRRQVLTLKFICSLQSHELIDDKLS